MPLTTLPTCPPHRLTNSRPGFGVSLQGLLAIIRRPVVGGALLAFLLGCAIGVMATLSVLELVLMNAFEHGVWEVSLSTAAGVAFYCLLEPMLPHMELPVKDTQPGESPAPEAAPGAPRSPAHASPSEDKGVAGLLQERARLLRLGMLMALTMTLHNLPEGFAVAFASFTSFGPVMALAVAIHNVPEGLIVAAPIFAATGQRWRAFSVALLSGLSEPLGALVALKFVKPFLTPLRLQYMLAGVGGISAWPAPAASTSVSLSQSNRSLASLTQ